MTYDSNGCTTQPFEIGFSKNQLEWVKCIRVFAHFIDIDEAKLTGRVNAGLQKAHFSAIIQAFAENGIAYDLDNLKPAPGGSVFRIKPTDFIPKVAYILHDMQLTFVVSVEWKCKDIAVITFKTPDVHRTNIEEFAKNLTAAKIEFERVFF